MAGDSAYEDVIASLQISLRKEAGVSSYNPRDTSFPILPSPQDAIPLLDPSPPYLRCAHCKGRLLRGINAIICVFCGRQPHHKDVPPDPIKFISTSGSRWFLQSLDLDGSELVELNESNGRQTVLQKEIPLSEFLDLEIRWPSVSEKLEAGVWESNPDQKLRTLDLNGVDFDDFFAEEKTNFVSATMEERSTENKQNNASISDDAVQGHEDLSLFENIQHSEMVARLDEDGSGDPSSSWEAEFQSANLGTQHQESKPFDPFVASSAVDLSAHMDSVFGTRKDLSDEKQTENIKSSSSNTNDWRNVDSWGNLISGESGLSEQSKGPINDKDDKAAGVANSSSSMNVDWFQGDQLPTSNDKETDSKIIDDDDSFDDWKDFTSSSGMQVPSNSSLMQDADQATLSIKQSSEMNLFDGSSTPQQVDLGSFVQPDLFSGTFNSRNGSTVHILQSETSFSDRTAGVNAIDGESAEEVERDQDGLNGKTKSKANEEVEMLMSQMHDLSFMLENNLSVPGTKDPFDPFSTV